MISVTYYKKSTGEIVSCVSLSDLVEIESNQPDECNHIEGTYDGRFFWVVNGELQEKPPSPGNFYVFDYMTGEWVPDDETAWAIFKSERNLRLAACDWTQVPDAPVDHQAWAVYRQQLRDLPENTEDPRHPVWPTPPA